MKATLFCAQRINNKFPTLEVGDFNITFPVLSLPTLFNLDLAASVTDMDLNQNFEIKIVILEEESGNFILNHPVGQLFSDEGTYSTTITTTLNSLRINNAGWYRIELHANDVIIGSTQIKFMVMNNE